MMPGWRLRTGLMGAAGLILAVYVGRGWLLGQVIRFSTWGLPNREPIQLIEGATYRFGRQGTWFMLSDETVVPPLSYEAFVQGQAQFPTAITPAMDEKFFWLLQGSPFVTAIAADLERGKLSEFLDGKTFNTDRFFVEYFVPVYVESSLAAGLDPGEALWMLEHGLMTLQDPLLRNADATPIIQGAGTVGSFWEREQLLAHKQLALRRWIARPGWVGHWVRYGVFTHLQGLRKNASLASRQLTSTPEVIVKLPHVTFGAEEGAIAHALGILQFDAPGVYSPHVTQIAQQVVNNERQKQVLRSQILAQLEHLTTAHGGDLAQVFVNLSRADWDTFQLGHYLFPAEAAQLNGSNTVSILLSRSEKAGLSAERAYPHARALLLRLLENRAFDRGESDRDRVLFAILKDHAFMPQFWTHLARRSPTYTDEVQTLAAGIEQYQHLAHQGATLIEQLYGAMIAEGHDIGVSASLKHAVGFQAHLASLIDAALMPEDPKDPRYQTFRRTVAIYLREAPDMAVYAGTRGTLRLYGQEHLNVQELIATDLAAAARLQAFARLYQTALASGLVTQWDIEGIQRILVFGALVAAGVEPNQLPAGVTAIAIPDQQFREDLLFLVGPEGIALEGTHLGIRSHDYRVSFQPFTLPTAMAEASPDAGNPNAAPPCLQAAKIDPIALGPAAQFQWHPQTQRVVLMHQEQVCPLDPAWSHLFFETHLGYVALEHSPRGAQHLNQQLQSALMLEAGMF